MAALIAFLLVEAGGVALVVVEGHKHHPHLTIVDGLWWAMATVTTVGYGDVTALTNTGRLIGMCIMMIGLGFVAVVTGSIAQYVIARKAAESQAANTTDIVTAISNVMAEVRSLSARLDRLETELVAPDTDASGEAQQEPTPRRRRRPGHQPSAR
jgi:voltage-gated potassium channel